MNEIEKNRLSDMQWSLWWGVCRSIRYHDRRIAWFDCVHRTGRFITLLAGGAAATAILKSYPQFSLFMSLVCAVFSAIDLAYDVSAKARLHSSLKVKFIDIERKISLIGYDKLDEEQIREFTAVRLEIERDEPTILKCLDTECRNELCRAEGIKERIQLKWWQKMLLQVWSGDPPEEKDDQRTCPSCGRTFDVEL